MSFYFPIEADNEPNSSITDEKQAPSESSSSPNKSNKLVAELKLEVDAACKEEKTPVVEKKIDDQKNEWTEEKKVEQVEVVVGKKDENSDVEKSEVEKFSAIQSNVEACSNSKVELKSNEVEKSTSEVKVESDENKGENEDDIAKLSNVTIEKKEPENS